VLSLMVAWATASLLPATGPFSSSGGGVVSESFFSASLLVDAMLSIFLFAVAISREWIRATRHLVRGSIGRKVSTK